MGYRTKKYSKRKRNTTIRRKYTNTRYRRKRGRSGKDWKNSITLSILSWKSPETLKNTLNSYKEKGLLNLVRSSIYFQERNEQTDDIAREYGIETILGTKENVLIRNAFITMVENTTTPYFIFAECDFVLTSSTEKMITVLEDCIKLMREANVKLVRLRDQRNPGKPFYAPKLIREGQFSYESTPHKLELVSTVENPEELMKTNFIIKAPPEYKYKWYICDFKCTRWTNNIFIADTKFLKDVVLPYIKNPLYDTMHANLEDLFFREESPLKEQLQAAGEGLFTHTRLDR